MKIAVYGHLKNGSEEARQDGSRGVRRPCGAPVASMWESVGFRGKGGMEKIHQDREEDASPFVSNKLHATFKRMQHQNII